MSPRAKSSDSTRRSAISISPQQPGKLPFCSRERLNTPGCQVLYWRGGRQARHRRIGALAGTASWPVQCRKGRQERGIPNQEDGGSACLLGLLFGPTYFQGPVDRVLMARGRRGEGPAIPAHAGQFSERDARLERLGSPPAHPLRSPYDVRLGRGIHHGHPRIQDAPPNGAAIEGLPSRSKRVGQRGRPLFGNPTGWFTRGLGPPPCV